jgi:hypothetical protein
MNGDFSKLEFNPLDNFTGVLHQQGRALSDQDGNASTFIASHLRELQGRDTIGPHVAAVPAEMRDSFKVVKVETDGAGVRVTLHPGRVWVDGLVLQVGGVNPYTRSAEYLGPRIQDPQADPASILESAENVRDAVILELWEEAFNAFQAPVNLIEAALGGVDTTERAKLFHRLRLLRLGPDDECGNLADKLADDFPAKGKLTVTQTPNSVIAGDCPVELGGGYSGFLHYLYRIEIAEPDSAGNARFKWSRFGGGLVGRGTYKADSQNGTKGTVEITANDQMIIHCGLPKFYLEALRQEPHSDNWTAVFTADATLTLDNKLSLTGISPGSTWPSGEAFFRLWDGVRLIKDFAASLPAPTELENGLRLGFDDPSPGSKNYTPGDYWTFPVRAAGVDFDPSVWPNNAPPQGIHYHRAPLAVLEWPEARNRLRGRLPSSARFSERRTASHGFLERRAVTAKIHDCRRVFQPLSQLDSCCSYTVGDGMLSHGDYDSIQAAINNLPPGGGQICVLPGQYQENILINKSNISIHGCGRRSLVTGKTSEPVIHIDAARNVHIDKLQIVAQDGPGILVDRSRGPTYYITLRELEVSAGAFSAIAVYGGQRMVISDNTIVMEDVASPWPGLFLSADDVLVEHNAVVVEPEVRAKTERRVPSVSSGRGGVQIGGFSERISIIDNLIQGGIGNGITLGTLREVDGRTGRRDRVTSSENVDEKTDVTVAVKSAPLAWVVNAYDPCDPCAPGSTYKPPDGEGEKPPTYESAGALYDIRIERNRILDMGLNGIGVVAFFNLDKEDEFISVVGLEILGNTIKNCLTRSLEQIPDEMVNSMGYGGIALADVENLIVHDNVIEDNGKDHLEPICGIFVLHGEGIDISRNRILNNGAKTSQPTSNAKLGCRGGINVVFAVSPKTSVLIEDKAYPRQNGVPALKVSDNIVSQPLGRALSSTALGPVCVEGNEFTSRGVVLQEWNPSFIAATVAIMNLGLSSEWRLQVSRFSGGTIAAPVDTERVTLEEDTIVVPPRQGLDDRAIGRYLANGNVKFNDNQCVLDLQESCRSLALTSIAILSLDDVAFHNNQCDCDLLNDFIFVHAAFLGFSVRVNDNRFKEDLLGALLSSASLGLFLNMITNNQASHCLLALRSPLDSLYNTEILQAFNQVTFEVFSRDFCERLAGASGTGGNIAYPRRVQFVASNNK